MFIVKRHPENPILGPVNNHPFEAAGAFNPCSVIHKNKTILLYRALAEPELMDQNHISISSVGIAESADGAHFENRRQLIAPKYDWEKFGCEDPRVTKLGSKYYIFYTALSKFPFSADGIKIAVAVTSDFEKIEKHPVTPFNAKAMAIFPQKIGGKFAALLTVNCDKPPSEIAYVEFEKEEDIWSPEFWNKWYPNLEAHKISLRRAESDHLELGAPPVLTKKGWLIIYSHIQHYTGGGEISFGIEAALLDLKNPRIVLGKTKGAFLTAEEHYEKFGNVGNITFPTGALVEGKNLKIFYGAADTFSCLASANLKELLDYLLGKQELVKRFGGNPILVPRKEKLFEAKGVFNPAAIELDDKIHLLYRAVSDKNVSTFGYAKTNNGFTIDERSEEPIYLPRAPFEKTGNGEGGGVEDPRFTKISDRLYILYTAFDGRVPRVAISSINEKDFLAKKWLWSEPELVSAGDTDDKDACVLPKKIGGKFMILHRIGGSICADFTDSLNFEKQKIDKCIEILEPRMGMWDGAKVGIAAPPIETKIGWLLLYHGVSKTTHYRVGAALLDLKDPTIVISRTALPIFEAREDYEIQGAVPNVVFPCGAVLRKDEILIYYGAADSVVGTASLKLSEILKILTE
ncbi:MAG: hypothetical protein WC673_00275 [Candidatus Paceibacterota bacterium]|jgi:predicted GH43/DUF377 family glycosyl hydrolase